MSDSQPAPEELAVRPFAAWLQEQRGGLTHAELTGALHELAEAVTTYAKPGSLTLTIKLKPAEGDRGAVIVADDVTLKAPQPDRAPAVYFVDEAHNLTRDNPYSVPMPTLREVPSPATAEELTRSAQA